MNTLQYNKLPILIVCVEFAEHSLLQELRAQLRSEGFTVRALDSYADFFDLGAQQHFSAFLFALPQKDEEYQVLDSIIAYIRHYDEEVPILLCGKEKDYQVLSRASIRQTSGFIHYGEDTVEFTARDISRKAHYYLKTSLPIFFRHLIEYVQNGAHSWHCPGHSGGTAFLKSHVGQIFHQFFGENLLRADVCNAVKELGQLLEHSGYIGESERNAARIFRADTLYFVTSGTSTSNKIVAQANITQGDLVLVDRNCHQSVLHSITQTGAIPIFLRPSRNIWGISGPIPEEQFSREWIEKAIYKHPLAAEGAKLKAIILTQSTYDGILYHSDRIKKKLDAYIPVLHFDEAWIPHAVFHDFYSGMHAMGGERTKYSTVYATQSPHKILAGLSQASQILVQNATETPLDPAPLEASFLMNSSTSPQYSILASLDVSAAMMSGTRGHAIIEETLQEALNFRQALRDCGENLDSWWFCDWGPPDFSLRQKDWHLSGDWHGFEPSGDFNILDPLKCSLLTPGLDEAGELREWGIPAVVVSRYLEENGIIVEKTGLYSIFIMFTIGITKGRWKNLLVALQRFKQDYDTARSLWQSMPQFCQQYPQYADYNLSELCQSIHCAYRKGQIVRQTELAYSSELQPQVTPSEAYRSFVCGQYKGVPLADICGQVSASMISIYPPGIPLVFPGEVISQEVQNYLSCIEQHQFPGFEIHIHGLVKSNPEQRGLINILQ